MINEIIQKVFCSDSVSSQMLSGRNITVSEK